MIGSVFQTVTDAGEQQYVVLPDGVAKVNDTTAAALRATNSYGLISPPSVESSVVAKIPEQVYTSPLPDKPLEMLLREDAPTLCWSWQREPGDQSPKTTVITGRHLPIAAASMNTGIDQIGGDATVFIDGGQYVRLQSPDPRYGESLYYIDPQGVRYGLPNEDTAGNAGPDRHRRPRRGRWSVCSSTARCCPRRRRCSSTTPCPPTPNPRKVADGRTPQPATARTGGGG